MYQQVTPWVAENRFIKRLADNAFIPFDPQNTDYAEYLAWLSSGNVPLPPSDSVDEVAGTLTPTQEN